MARLETDKEVILTEEPQAGFWRGFVGGFMRVLLIRSQLQRWRRQSRRLSIRISLPSKLNVRILRILPCK